MDYEQEEINSTLPPTSSPCPRRNSVNVASVYLGYEQGSSDETTSSTRSNDFGDDGDNMKRRNSLNVASFYRSREAQEHQQEQPSVPNRSLGTVQVRSSVIQQHIQFEIRHGTAGNEETKDDCSIGDSPTTQLSSSIQLPSRVQFTIPDEYDYICDDGLHDEDFTYRRPQRTVTFGAYYDTHNDEMIPELVPIVVSSPSKESNTSSTTTAGTSSSLSYFSPRRIQQHYRSVQQLISDAPPVVQMIATFTSCILTYAVMGAYPTVHLQVMTMVLVVLCGATFPHLITAVACGVYAGSVRQETISSYPGIALLSTLTAIVWQIVSQRKLLLGFSGRLGASAFIGMNMTAIITFAFADSTTTEGYTRYGEPNWTNKMDWEEVIVTIVATIFLATTASWFRLGATVPVNPVLVPSTWALFCMLLISLTDYRYSGSIFDGFAVGSYVAMAAESRLPNICRFAMVGFLAGLGIVLFNPFFLGFGGKSGFTAMTGYSTYLAIQTFTRYARKKIRESKDNKEPVLPK